MKKNSNVLIMMKNITKNIPNAIAPFLPNTSTIAPIIPPIKKLVPNNIVPNISAPINNIIIAKYIIINSSFKLSNLFILILYPR